MRGYSPDKFGFVIIYYRSRQKVRRDRNVPIRQLSAPSALGILDETTDYARLSVFRVKTMSKLRRTDCYDTGA